MNDYSFYKPMEEYFLLTCIKKNQSKIQDIEDELVKMSLGSMINNTDFDNRKSILVNRLKILNSKVKKDEDLLLKLLEK
jgi:hypothetical protein